MSLTTNFSRFLTSLRFRSGFGAKAAVLATGLALAAAPAALAGSDKDRREPRGVQFSVWVGDIGVHVNSHRHHEHRAPAPTRAQIDYDAGSRAASREGYDNGYRAGFARAAFCDHILICMDHYTVAYRSGYRDAYAGAYHSGFEAGLRARRELDRRSTYPRYRW